MVKAGIAVVKLDAIFISHLHGDHYYGLPGLIDTLCLQQREEKLIVYGPQGIQKMAESTAGKPLEIGVFVNKKSGYAETKPGIIDVIVKGHPRKNRKMKLGYHFKNDRFRLESTCEAYLEEINLPDGESDELDIHLKLHAENAKPRDVISFTITVSEIENDVEIDRRGVSTVVHLV